MSASRPSKLVLDEDDDWGSFSPLPSGESRLSSSATSGEFNAFAVVGSVAGGGSKRQLWVFPTEGPDICLGKVGLNNNKFCVKECEEGKAHCGVNRHGQKFDIIPDTAYIRVSDNQVLSFPTMDLTPLSWAQRSKLLAATMSAADWDLCFQSIQACALPEWLLDEGGGKENLKEDDGHSFNLLSPVDTKEKHGIFKLVPTFSFDSEVTEDDKENLGTSVSTTEGRVKKLEDKLVVLKEKLARPFMDIDASYTVLTSDLVKLHDKVKQVAGTVGPIRNSESVSHWIEAMTQRVKSLEDFKSSAVTKFAGISSAVSSLKEDQNHVMEEVSELQALATQHQGWVSVTDQTLEVFRKRFAVIRPFLNRFSDAKDEENAPGASVEALSRQVADLQEKIKILENRVVGSGVQMGNCVFQSFEDMHKWVQVQVPKGRFGLFVDGHSFLELFTLSGHIDTEAGTAAFSHSMKAGFSTYIEAQLAISFKNLFPAVFGKGGSSTMDDSECLPAIACGDKWNNGSTGMHHQLLRNMNDVSYQIDSTIKKVLHDHLEARQLAIDCVTASKRFAIDLITFMSQEYATWQQRGFSKKDAWRIVCQIVRRIFEDLQSARISARNIQDFEDMDFTTASFLYATLKCHEVMETYVKHQFHAHPHVSSVITRHLAANFVKPDQSQESKIDALENKVNTIFTKLDSHTSKIDVLINKEKDKVRSDKDTKGGGGKKGKAKNDGGES